MAVIINEFEVVVEQAEAPAEGQAGNVEPQPKPQPQPQLTPQDIYDIVHRQFERMVRVWAH